MSTTSRVTAILAASILGATGVAGCTGKSQPTATTVVASGATCPQIIRVQTSWYPEVLSGGLYQTLIGGQSIVDTHRKRISGPLMDRGKPTGLTIELRPGGPALADRASAGSMLKRDRSLFIGQESLQDMLGERIVGVSTVAVMAPEQQNPVMFAWSTTAHPEFHTLQDIGTTNTPVFAFQGSTTNDYLVGAGILRNRQLNFSYDGSPAALTTDHGVVVGGISTNEPYIYAHLPSPIKLDYAYVSSGDSFPTYHNLLTVRSSDAKQYEDCLRWLVPVLQRSHAAFLANPTPVLRLMSDLDKRYPATFQYPLAQGEWGITVIQRDGIMDDGPGRRFGAISPERVAKVIAALRPIFAGQHRPLPDDVTPDALVTNAYLAPIRVGP